MKVQGIDRKTLPFAPRMQPYAGWWCVCGSAFVLFVRTLCSVQFCDHIDRRPPRCCLLYYECLQFSGWEVFLKGNWSYSTFLTDYIPVILFPILFVTAKFVMRVPSVNAYKMDFISNVAEFDAMTCVPLYPEWWGCTRC